jgi:hypothetical protein
MTNIERPFIGPKPEVEEPVWTTPFRTDDNGLWDANDNYVGTVSGDASSPEDDESLAELIVTLINRYVTAFEDDPMPEPKAEFVGRTIFREGETIDIDSVRGGCAFGYEVAPGRFWFAANRAAALAETEADPKPGWLIYEAGRYLDVVTGDYVPIS